MSIIRSGQFAVVDTVPLFKQDKPGLVKTSNTIYEAVLGSGSNTTIGFIWSIPPYAEMCWPSTCIVGTFGCRCSCDVLYSTIGTVNLGTSLYCPNRQPQSRHRIASNCTESGQDLGKNVSELTSLVQRGPGPSHSSHESTGTRPQFISVLPVGVI